MLKNIITTIFKKRSMNEVTTIYPKWNNGISRPKWDDEMRKELAQIVGKKVFDWCNRETDLDDCIESAEKVMEWHRHDNGYELAKEFDEEGFNPDAELVEILESVSYDAHEIEQKAIKKWVSDNNLKLDYEVGQIVLAKLVRLGEVECEVVNLYPDTLQYGLWNDSLGYEKGKGSRIVNQEDVIKLI